MRSEIRRIDPVRFANVLALVYALFSLVFVVLMLPFLLLGLTWGDSGGVLGVGITLFFVLMYPLFGLFFGWLSGLLGAALYNLVARWVGGILIELAAEPPAYG
jgi:hypothetical protein